MRVSIQDANGKPMFNHLIDDGTNVLRFISGFGFVTREEVIRQHWIIIRDGSRRRGDSA